MARAFTIGGNYYKSAPSAIFRSPSYPWTMACWLNLSALTSTGTAFSVANHLAGSTDRIEVGFDSASGKIRGLTSDDSSVSDVPVVGSAISANTWYPVVFVGTSSTNRTLYSYQSGSLVSTNTTVSQVQNLVTVFSIGISIASGGSADFGGSVANACFWYRALTQAEVLSFCQGASPYTIQPGPIFYFPLDGLTAPEVDLSGGAHNAPLGAGSPNPTLAPGPPTALFTPRSVSSPAALFTGTGTSGARSFILGSSNQILVNAAPVDSYPWTIFCWLQSPLLATTNNQTAFSIQNQVNNQDIIAIGSDHALQKFFAYVSDDNAAFDTINPFTTLPSLNTWYPMVYTGTSATSRTVYSVQAGSVVSATSTSNIVNNNHAATVMVIGGSFGGKIADCAVWNVVLTASEAAALCFGARPGTIRPTALKAWLPLDGLQSTEPDLSGLANNGVVTLTTPTSGPPIMPFTPRWPQVTPAVVIAPDVLMAQGWM